MLETTDHRSSNQTADQHFAPPATFQNHTLRFVNYRSNESLLNQISELGHHSKTSSMVFFLQITNNNCPGVIRTLSFANLNHLKKMMLVNNCVDTIEGLCRVVLPALQELVIGHDQVTDFHGLRKLHTPSLKKIDIQGTKYTKNILKSLALIDTPCLAQIGIYFFKPHNNLEDCRPLLKINSKKFSKAFLKIDLKREEEVVAKQLMKKHSGIYVR